MDWDVGKSLVLVLGNNSSSSIIEQQQFSLSLLDGEYMLPLPYKSRLTLTDVKEGRVTLFLRSLWLLVRHR